MGTLATESVKRDKKKQEIIYEYFQVCRETIDEVNRYMLRKACKDISIIYLIMVAVGYLVVPTFHITIVHILMLPFMLTFYFINLQILKRETISTLATQIICTIFYFGLALFFISIDTIIYSENQTFFVPMLILVFPALYIDRVYKYGIQELVVVIIFCILSFIYKDWNIFRRDVFMVLSAYVVSMFLGNMILDMRSGEALALRELKGISSLDKLTHVLNKGALLTKIDNYFIQKPEEDYCAMAIIDMDDFKLVNDNLGHNTGDILLEKVGQLLMDSFRAYDIVGRYGGDEFVVLMPKMSDPEILKMRCKRLQDAITSFSIGNSKPFSASIGAVITKDIRNGNAVFMLADDALYESKLEGKGRCTTWIVDKQEYDKPIILNIGHEREGIVNHLRQDLGEGFRIIDVKNDDDALHQISQHKTQIGVVIIELESELGCGTMLLKYIKSRESFADIPVLAIVSNEQDSLIARNLRADEVVTSDTPYVIYREKIKQLVGM